MSSKQLPQENETAGPDDELSGNKLKDLEQHISQRINRLSDAEIAALELEDPDNLPGRAHFIPPFEPMESFTFPEMDVAEPDYRNVYDGVRSSYQGISELLISVHELGDILTESVLSLNVRLSSIEQRLADSIGEDGTDNATLIKEVKTLLQQSQSLLKQNLSALKQKPSLSDSKEGTEVPASPEILHELQRQMKLLEEHVSKSNKEVKQKVDERQSQLREQLDIRAKILEKLTSENREYLNRHFFSLAILFIIILFIASALTTNSIDRLSGYMAEQQESLHLQLEQLSLQHSKASAESARP